MTVVLDGMPFMYMISLNCCTHNKCSQTVTVSWHVSSDTQIVPVSFTDGVSCGLCMYTVAVLAIVHMCTFSCVVRLYISEPSACVCTIPSMCRSAASNSQPSSASLQPSTPKRASMGSPEEKAPHTSPPQKDTQPKAPPTSPLQKDTQPKAPPTSPPQKDIQPMAPPTSPPQKDIQSKTPPTSPPQEPQSSVAVSPQQGTPSKGVAGKVRASLMLHLLSSYKVCCQLQWV